MKKSLLLVLALSYSAWLPAAPITIVAPAGATSVPISIYPAGNPAAGPVLQLKLAQPAELPAGKYQFGFDSYAYRSAPFVHKAAGATRIVLGALALTAPEGVTAEFTLFARTDGRLLFPLTSGEVRAVPAGAFRLRRDLGELPLDVAVSAGKRSEVALGAIRLRLKSLPGSLAIYVAPAAQDRIAAVLFAKQVVAALPPGEYRLRVPGHGGRASVRVRAGRSTPVRTTHLHWASVTAADVTARGGQGEQTVKLPGRGRADRLLLAGGLIRIDAAGQPPLHLPVPETGRLTVWRLSNGRLINAAGLPLDLPDDVAPLALPGGTLKLISEAAESATATITLRQGDQPLQKRDVHLRQGKNNLELAIPETLTPGTKPWRFDFGGGVRGRAVTGQRTLAVHRPLKHPPTALQVSETGPTRVSLIWKAPAGKAVYGYRIFRDDDPRPASGAHPVLGLQFNDIALSAGRTYRYRVHPVDKLGQLGPAATILAKTPPRR